MNDTQQPARPSLKLVTNPHRIQHGDTVRTPRCTQSATKMSHDDIYMDFLLNGAGRNVHHPDLHYFLVAVLSQTEVRQLLTRSVVVNGCIQGPRIAQLLPIAKHFQRMTFFAPAECDAIYVAAILHGIEYWLKPCVQGDTTVHDVMTTIVQDALRRLDRQSPEMSQALRLCMGWGNCDEESVFTEWLQERMHQAIRVLDQSQR